MKKLLLLFAIPILAWSQVTVIQSPTPQFRSFLPSGAPNASGCVYTFTTGTSTPQATYTDFTGNTPNTNPVILDGTGSANIWISSAVYRIQVWSFGSGSVGSNCGNGTQLYQVDGIKDTGLNALNGPVSIAPTSNGIDIFSITRATDISASGNFLNFKSFAGTPLFKVDINGNFVAAAGNLGNGNSFSPVTFSNHNQIFWAGPGATPTIDQAVTACGASTNACMVEISPQYTGPESLNLVTTSIGYQVYVNGIRQNIMIKDNRENPGTPGNPTATPLYPLIYRGRLAGQLVSEGVNNVCSSPTDSCAGSSSFNWITGTMPSNGGQQGANFNLAWTYGSVVWGTAVPSITVTDAEGYHDATSNDIDLPYFSGYTAQVGMNRSNATGNIGTVANFAANGCPNVSSTGKIRDCYGADFFKTTTGTSRNYGFRSQEPVILENVGTDPSIDFSEVSTAISSLSESGSTVTVTTTVSPCTYPTGTIVYISQVGGTNPPPTSQMGYNGTWTVLTPGCNGGNTFTYTNTVSGLATVSSNAGRVQGVHKFANFNSTSSGVEFRPYADSVGWRYILNSGTLQGFINSSGLFMSGQISPGSDNGAFLGGGSFHFAGLFLTRCTSAASPAVCGAASTGFFVIAAAATNVVVNTTEVSASSTIQLTRDNSLGSALGVTCNTQTSLTLGSPQVSARTAGTSFTAVVDVAPTTNPMCISFTIIN